MMGARFEETAMLDNLYALLARGTDNPLLRFGLGKGHLDAGEASAAVEHLRRCVEQDPGYSAAWKLLGRACLESGDTQAARQAWEQGLEVAQAKGDKQTERELGVFLKRLARQG